MSAPAQAQVLDLLRAEGPLTPDEITARLVARGSLTSKNPRQTIRGALNTNARCVPMGDGRYCYLPTFINGATIQQPMEVVAPDKRLIAATVERIVLFWSAGRWHELAAVPTLDLAGGPTVAIDHDDRFFGWLHTLRLPLALPAPFWDWWGGQQHAGADTLFVRCEDGEAKRFAIRAVRRADLDGDAVSAGNDRLRAAVVHILKRQRHLRPDDLSRRLFAAGIYHPPIPPDPLRIALFDPPGPFFRDNNDIAYRPEITPALRRLFAPRIEFEHALEESLLRGHLERGDNLDADEEDDLTPAEQAAYELPPIPERAERLYRLRVRLQRNRRVWRVIEILDNQTLVALHEAIQRAFAWDNDHLYAFYLGGRVGDRLTQIDHHFELPFGESEPPTADEVIIADLGLERGQVFLYRFDFSDNLDHAIEVLGSAPAPTEDDYPRIAESHGAAPSQYPTYESDDPWDPGEI